ncbi:head-tail connector protein [Cohnella sp. AR92]|uniref:head-tail connector protein n=1 Tax=Cohnella sp. AR92 TaxID=648716 RepID=UPI000F8C6BC8|nr:head-tail connector protein [Cohnella sp. AR92]RUS47561.1 DNA-packaging protein [Cohnella sp. AR92]
MAMMESVKKALRISPSNTAFDEEVSDLIAAARDDLKLSGVLAAKADLDEPDPLVKRAIITYAKANFGYDNPDADRLRDAYSMLKAHLTLSQEFTVGDDA